MSTTRVLLPHLAGHSMILAVLAWVSVAGDGWGYLVLYAGVTALLAVVIGLSWAADRLLCGDKESLEQRQDIARRTLRSFVHAELTLGLAILVTATVARLGSGPIGPFAGGPFQQAASSELPMDLEPLDAEEIQLQIPSDPPYTITTHGFVIDGALYAGADFAFPFKRWVHIVQKDPAVLVRIDGRLFRCRAVRIRDPAASRRLLEEVSRQRGVQTDDWLTDVWFFRMEPTW